MTLADKYRLEVVLGVGGSGYVYRAEQLGLGRKVAVKLLRSECGDHLELFHNEARAASRINPNAITIYDFGISVEGRPFLVMEYLGGATLSAVIDRDRERLPISRILKITAQMLSALEAAHECNVVHRDLKSCNVILEPQRSGEDLVKVIDFGLAVLDAVDPHEFAGTPEYMAPELIARGIATPFSDLYAVGVVLYEMIVGRTPFAGGELMTILDRHQHMQPTPPHQIIPACPAALGELCLHALAKSPADRPQSATAMRARVLEILNSAAVSSGSTCGRCGAPSIGQTYCAQCGADRDVRHIVSDGATRGPSRTLADGTGASPVVRPRSTTLQHAHTVRVPLRTAARELTLVGRRDELERVRRFYRGGELASTLALIGTSGVGRSRLVREVARELEREVTTFCAGPDPSGAATPWYPVLSMLEHVLGIPSSVDYPKLLEALARCGLPERDGPGLAELFGAVGPLAGLELAVRRREAHAAAVRALREVDRRHPRAVLFFADADHYDQPSTNLLDMVAQALDGTGTRMIVSMSDQDNVPSGAAVMPVLPLDAATACRLAADLIDEQASTPTPELVAALTGGVPVAIEQLAGWMARGHLPAEAPSQLVDLLAVRVSVLAPVMRRVLQAVVVHGSVVSRELVEATLSDVSGFDEALDDLVRSRLIVLREHEIAVPSPLLAEVVRSCLPAGVRRDLHTRALEAYSRLGVTVSPGVLAPHAELSGQHERAYFLYQAAGDDAVRRFDDAGGAQHHSRAVAAARALIAEGDPEAPARFAEASVRLADALRFAGMFRLAAGTLDEAELMTHSPIGLARIARARGRLALSTGNPSVARMHLTRTIGLAMRGFDRDFLCETYIDLAAAIAAGGDEAAAIRELEEGIDLVTAGQGLATVEQPADRLWLAAIRLTELRIRIGKWAEAEAVAVVALDMAGRSAPPQATGRLCALLAQIAEGTGELRRALDWRARAIEVLRCLGDRRSTAELLVSNAEASRRLGPTVVDGDQHRWKMMTEVALHHAAELALEIGVDAAVGAT